jgi:hypothetical protein
MLDVEQAAQTQMISYLIQRYQTAKVFTNTSVYSPSAIYGAKDLVEYTEPAFNAATVYLTGDRISYDGKIYQSTSGSAAGAFNIANWTYLVDDLSLFFVNLPFPEFNPATSYSIGDVVWYNGSVYTAAVATKNIYPDSSTQYWGTGTPYTITNILPTVGATWTQGDNRNQEIVMNLIDITLFHLHTRINPRNIPDLRKQRYNGDDPMDRGGSIGWLKHVASGDVNADLPKIVPSQGLSISWGSANGSGSGGTYTISNNTLW